MMMMALKRRVLNRIIIHLEIKVDELTLLIEIVIVVDGIVQFTSVNLCCSQVKARSYACICCRDIDGSISILFFEFTLSFKATRDVYVLVFYNALMRRNS